MRAESPRQNRSNIRCAASGADALAVVLDRHPNVVAASRRATTATVPSDGVWRSAFVSRLSRTRSTCSGAQRAGGTASCLRAARAGRSCVRASASNPLRHDSTSGASCDGADLERERAGVDAGELEEVVDEHCRAGAPARGAGRGTRPGSARPSSIASSMAVIDAIGVRRSWLAAATSSRRASKRPSRLAAISLNDRPSSASSRGPSSGARARRARRRRAAPKPAAAVRCCRAIEVPRASAAATAAEAAAAATARIFTSSPMWNITQPERSTARSGSSTASSASPISCRRSVGSSRSASGGDEADGERDAERRASANTITARTGSRRPRPSRGAAGSSGRRSIFARSRRTCTVTRSRVERRRVSPDAVHQLAAREDLARDARRGRAGGRTPSPSARSAVRRRTTSRADRASSSSPPSAAARSARRMRGCARGARSRTRTASSRGENGFVT